MEKEKLITIISVAVMGIAFGILFGDTIVGLARDWYINDNYSYGFYVPFISAYLIWQKRSAFHTDILQPSRVGFAIFLAAMLLFVIGNVGAEQFTERTAMVLTIAGLWFYFFGKSLTVTMAMPLAYLMFMIPLPAIIWNQVSFPLQLLASQQASSFSQWIGIPVLREGNILHLSNTVLQVVDACSGLRSVTTMLALSTFFSYTMNRKNINRLLIVLSAVPIALLLNIIRLVATVVLAKYFNPEIAQSFLHDLSGYFTFFIGLVLIYGLCSAVSVFEKRRLRSEMA